MSDKIHDGGPAFPPAYEPDPNDYTKAVYRGLTKRDWFAGQALAGLMAHSFDDGGDFLHECGPDAAAYQSYRMADAMLRARTESLPLSKGQEEGNG
ncbi:MAG: hypothetical protein QHC90_13355 [Shinella sp.]|nr:hypothetical protein [Shinella sp.]